MISESQLSHLPVKAGEQVGPIPVSTVSSGVIQQQVQLHDNTNLEANLIGPPAPIELLQQVPPPAASSAAAPPPPLPPRVQLRWKALKLLVVLIFSIVCLILVPKFAANYHQQSLNRTPDFSHFQSKYSKTYTSSNEQAYREFVYYKQLQKIAKHNADSNTRYTMGVNQFTDITEKEFVELYMNVKAVAESKGYLRRVVEEKVIETEEYEADKDENATDFHGDVDWIKLFPPVKNQYRCASCYSFPITAAVEALYAQKDGVVRSFSEQQLIDCATPEGKNGCEDGSIVKGFNYIIKNGIREQKEYQYTSKSGRSKTCLLKPSNNFKISKLVPIKRGYCTDIARILMRQPVVAQVDSSGWGGYEQGIFDNCGTIANHGVIIVGKTKDYWLVRNSWGKSWGEYGYVRLARGNTCGICESASFAVLE